MAGGGGGGGKGRADSALNINLTPMIDCCMLLVVFFMMTTQMADPKFSPMMLPKPTRSIAVENKENRAVINVVPFTTGQIAAGEGKAEDAMEYTLDTHHYRLSDLSNLSKDLADARNTSPDPKKFTVEIRSDYRIDYTQVEPIFQVLQQTRISKVDVAAQRAPGGG
jgi:biopolymer transport protein ExbD